MDNTYGGKKFWNLNISAHPDKISLTVTFETDFVLESRHYVRNPSPLLAEISPKFHKGEAISTSRMIGS